IQCIAASALWAAIACSGRSDSTIEATQGNVTQAPNAEVAEGIYDRELDNFFGYLRLSAKTSDTFHFDLETRGLLATIASDARIGENGVGLFNEPECGLTFTPRDGAVLVSQDGGCGKHVQASPGIAAPIGMRSGNERLGLYKKRAP